MPGCRPPCPALQLNSATLLSNFYPIWTGLLAGNQPAGQALVRALDQSGLVQPGGGLPLSPPIPFLPSGPPAAACWRRVDAAQCLPAHHARVMAANRLSLQNLGSALLVSVGNEVPP
jgi:hypothetical protein